MPEITLSYQPRIVICIPVYGWVPGETLVSMASMLVNGFQSRLIIGIKVSSSSGRAPARNELVKQALELDPTHLLFLDTDITTPPDVCQRLLRHQKNIVSGLYYTRRLPHQAVVRKDKEWVSGPGKDFLDAAPPESFSEVGYIGFGCVLIHASVFKRAMAAETNSNPYRFFHFSNETHEGEDIYFCRKMHALGEKIYLDPECECGHIGTFSVTRSLANSRLGLCESLG